MRDPRWAQDRDGTTSPPRDQNSANRADANRQADQPGDPRTKRATEPVPWYTQPRGYVWLVLALALFAGGGRKLLQSLRARRAFRRLEAGNPTPAEIEALAEHGRLALPDLFGLLDPAQPEASRKAAGRALLKLWAKDELIAEEEKAVSTRLYDVQWKARRRYPRGLKAPIQFQVDFGLAGLEPQGTGLKPSQLEWQWRIRGAPRAALEQFSPWAVNTGPIRFELDPSDLTGTQEQAIAFQARVRTAGLTSQWELDLPQVPFRFEMDPTLEANSILTGPDAETAETMNAAVHLKFSGEDATGAIGYCAIDPVFAIAGQPALLLGKLNADLAHRTELEFRDPAGKLNAGVSVRAATHQPGIPFDQAVPLRIEAAKEPVLEQPGTYQVRLVLTPDPHVGWAHAEIRAVWPGQIVGAWHEVRIVRR